MRPDPAVVETFLRYARLLAARGYVHNTLGNIVMRVPHADFKHGVAYTKHAELSLEEMQAENVVITDIPTSHVLYGGKLTSIGHNLSREIACGRTSMPRSTCTMTRSSRCSARAR